MNQRTTTIVYNTDYNHTHASKKQIGVFTNKREAIAALKKQYTISREQLKHLWDMNQTQTNSDEEPEYYGEFILEQCPLNTIQD